MTYTIEFEIKKGIKIDSYSYTAPYEIEDWDEFIIKIQKKAYRQIVKEGRKVTQLGLVIRVDKLLKQLGFSLINKKERHLHLVSA